MTRDSDTCRMAETGTGSGRSPSGAVPPQSGNRPTSVLPPSLQDERVERAEVAALMALVRHGISTDVQGLLVHGDQRGTVPPGALKAAIRAALTPAQAAEVERPDEADARPCSRSGTETADHVPSAPIAPERERNGEQAQNLLVRDPLMSEHPARAFADDALDSWRSVVRTAPNPFAMLANAHTVSRFLATIDALAQADAASLPLVDERLRELREKAHKGPWARWEKDGSGWDDYAHELHGRVQSETHDIADFFHDEDRDFVVALVDWFDTLTATKPSGQVERDTLREAAKGFRLLGSMFVDGSIEGELRSERAEKLAQMCDAALSQAPRPSEGGTSDV